MQTDVKQWQNNNVYIKQIDIKSEPVTRHKEGYYIIIKKITQQEHVTIVNIMHPRRELPNT